MSLKLNRRAFLRGAAGAALPLPFLNLMEASAKTTNDGKPPVRFMTLFKPNGVHPPSWNINGGSEFDFRMSPLMKPFAHHKKDLLILDNMGDFGFSSHANSTRRFLSGHHQNTKAASVDQLRRPVHQSNRLQLHLLRQEWRSHSPRKRPSTHLRSAVPQSAQPSEEAQGNGQSARRG